MRILVADTPDDLAAVAAGTIGRLIREAGDRFTIGLAGGSTPRMTYVRLRDEDVEWEKVVGWMGDERWVPRDHPDCNARMASESLFDHVPAELLPVHQEGLEPAEAAARYEQTLETVLPRRSGQLSPDLVLLGLGEDGHTASLFPGTTALDEQERRYTAIWVPRLGVWRVTSTLPLLKAARHLMFLVAGQAKARTVCGLFEGGRPYPARALMGGEADVTWLLDAAAASMLTDTPRETL